LKGIAEGIVMSGSARWRFVAIIGTGALLAAAALTPARAQTYPSGPVRMLVPYGAGGATDVLARVFGEYLQRHLGQSFTIENRAGGAGQIGVAAAASAPNDGSTLFFTTTAPLTIAPLMLGKDARLDFVPIAIVSVQPAWLVARAASPFKTFADIVKHAKDNPGKLTFGTPGVGSESHLVAEALVRSAGIQLTHVPFRSGADASAPLLGGQIDLASLTTGTVAPLLKQGSIRAFSVSSQQRVADFPDVPTVAELGHPTASMLPWWGLMAPPGTPQAVVARLVPQLEAATKDAGVRERLAASFVQIEFAGPQEFGRRLQGEVTLYGDIIRAANIKLGQ
jgi:tripartite-type tricarboxylate transporter receptor subunit TctC